MKELYRLLGVKLAATTAYHPQGDGQTERVNQELEQFLCLCKGDCGVGLSRILAGGPKLIYYAK